jgi:hypothetical protein
MPRTANFEAPRLRLTEDEGRGFVIVGFAGESAWNWLVEGKGTEK